MKHFPDNHRDRNDRNRPGRRSYPGAKWLAGELTVVLDRLTEGDPLGLGRRVAAIRARESWFLAPERMLIRAQARAAFDAMGYRGQPALGEWLDGCIHRAVAELVVEQLKEERAASPPEEFEDLTYYISIARRIGIDREAGRLACTVLNALPVGPRRAYQALVIDGKPLRRFVAEGYGPPFIALQLSRIASTAVREAVQTKEPGQDG